MVEQLLNALRSLKEKAPLVHCLTNPISMNDCANLILAVGAKPIMAEHPEEVAEITWGASALVLNLGNISDVRIKAMETAAAEAAQRGIPIVLDPVGVACSTLRREFAMRLLQKFSPSLIKGNLSEIKALCGLHTRTPGVDADESGQINENTLVESAATVEKLAKRYQCTVLATGETDLIVGDGQISALRNGHPMLGEITGTGCMCGVLAGAFCSVVPPNEAAIFSAAVMSVSGEIAAAQSKGAGSFKMNFLDTVYCIREQDLQRRIHLSQWKGNA